MGLNLICGEEATVVFGRSQWLALLASVGFVLLGGIIRTRPPLPLEALWIAVPIYPLLGPVWAILFSLIEIVVPSSFIPTVKVSQPVGDTDFIYYSFVTLATLGYGEILPVTAQAKSFVILEIVTGVLYLAILIAVFLKRVE